MKKEAFRAYLEQTGYVRDGRKYTRKAITSRVSKCACVERDMNCDLDIEYANDKLAGIMQKPEGNIKHAVKRYRDFCHSVAIRGDIDSIEEAPFNADEDTSADSEEDAVSDAAFGLESQLRDFLAQNIQQISFNGMRLKLLKDGIEYATDAGFIDILAENEKGDFVVFELKRGRTSDHVIGQLSRYMGWVKENIGKEKNVYGVIVAKTIGSNLHYAKTVIPNIHLLEYEVSFNLKAAKRA